MPDQNLESTTFGALMVERDPGFALYPGLQPFGSVQIKVEKNKGTLSQQVGNLQPSFDSRGNGQYHLWLVASGGEKPSAVHVGEIKLDNYGQGSLTWDFNADNVGQSGRGIADFDQVVITFNLAGHEFHLAEKIPLLGHLIQMKGELKGKSKEKKGTSKPPWLAGGCPPPWMFEEGQSPMSMAGGCPPPWLGSGPFGPTLLHHNWLGPMIPPWSVPQQPWWPYSGSAMGPHPMMHRYPAQMVGVKFHEKGGVQYLVHGILGRFCKEDWPHQGQTGYRHWHPLPGNEYEAGHWGYWLLYIDPVTGQKANPMGDTIPPGC